MPFFMEQGTLQMLVGAHVDDLMCGGEGPEWEAAIKTLVSGLKFGDRKYPPFTYCGTDYTTISIG